MGIVYLFVFFILMVFFIGLMVGRILEFLGCKIEKWEIVFVSLIFLIYFIVILIFIVIIFVFFDILVGISNLGFYGIFQVAYEYVFVVVNNGFGFEGLVDNIFWWNLSVSFLLIVGCYVLIVVLIFLVDGMVCK